MRPQLLLLALVGLGAGCRTVPAAESPPPATPVVTPLPSDLAGVQAEIERLTQPPRATRASSCQAVAYGSKACGGPSRFVVVSTEATDTTRLRALAERYTALETDLNRREGRVSDCMLMPVPPVTLQEGVCVARR